MRSILWLLVGGLTAGGVVVAGTDVVTPRLAELFQQKMLLVVQQASTEPVAPRTTMFDEGEVNSYLRFKMTDQLPSGLSDPAVTLIGEGRVSGRAVIDLDAIRQKQGRGAWFDPTSYLSGKLPVMATGALRTTNGVGHFDLERTEVSGVPVPKRLLQEILSYYTRSADHPNGTSLDEDFELSAHIRRLDVETGRVIVVQ